MEEKGNTLEEPKYFISLPSNDDGDSKGEGLVNTNDSKQRLVVVPNSSMVLVNAFKNLSIKGPNHMNLMLSIKKLNLSLSKKRKQRSS